MDGLKARIRGGLESRRVFFFVTEEQITNESCLLQLQHKEKRDFRFISDYIFPPCSFKVLPNSVDIPHTQERYREYLCPTIEDQNRHSTKVYPTKRSHAGWTIIFHSFLWRYKLKLLLLLLLLFVISSALHMSEIVSHRWVRPLNTPKFTALPKPRKKQGRQI